jgi:hypothetical protein
MVALDYDPKAHKNESRRSQCVKPPNIKTNCKSLKSPWHSEKQCEEQECATGATRLSWPHDRLIFAFGDFFMDIGSPNCPEDACPSCPGNAILDYS